MDHVERILNILISTQVAGPDGRTRSPGESATAADVSRLEPGLIVQFEGFRDEVAARRAGRRALSSVAPDDARLRRRERTRTFPFNLKRENTMDEKKVSRLRDPVQRGSDV